MDDRKLNHVINELNNYGGPKKRINTASTFVLCPYHSESTPSGRVFHSPQTKSPGYFRCYGCGKKAPWDELAPKLGLKAYKWTKPTEQFAQPLHTREEEEQKIKRLIFSDVPADKKWRTIKTNLLIEIGVKKVVAVYAGGYKSAPMLWFPVIIKGTQRGYIRARMKKEAGKPSYLNEKGAWSSDFGLFPYDFAVRNNPRVIVLVEGPRDALRLLSYGIPAIAILGTTSWSSRKSRMIELTGAKLCVLCMDGDDAGLKALALLEAQLEGLIQTKIFSLTDEDSPYYQFADEFEPSKAAKAAGVDLWDPGSMPIKKIKELKALCLI